MCYNKSKIVYKGRCKMFCNHCEKEVPEQSVFCNHCGKSTNGLDEKVSQDSIQAKLPNKKIKIVTLVGIGAIAIIGVIVALLFFKDPTELFMKNIHANEYIEANNIYEEKIKGNIEKEKIVEEELKQEIKALETQFQDNKLTYEQSTNKLDTISKTNLVKNEVVGAKANIEKINNSRLSYNKGVEFIKVGEYEEALVEFKKVIEEDEKYQVAKQKIVEITEQYKKDILKEIDVLISNNDYEGANSRIKHALSILPGDEDIKVKQAVCDKKLQQIREEKKKKDAEKAKQEQVIVVNNAKIVEQSSDYKSLYPDMIQVIIKNNSNETIKDMVVSSIAFDKNGLPIKIKMQYSFGNEKYELEGNAEDVNIMPGETFGQDVGWSLDESHGIRYVLSCVKQVTYYSGETWSNPYYSYWREEYIQKPLPDELKK